MYRKVTLNIVFLFVIQLVFGQTDYDKVYAILQNYCISCHDNATPSAGLDLQGTGSNPEKIVYQNIFETASTNNYSTEKGYKIIRSGDPYRSTLFRKINKGLDNYISLNSNEGDVMPPTFDMDTFDIEFIRQWILLGADSSENNVDSSAIVQYYTSDNTVEALSYIPNPPEENEGFQMKVGPYFVKERGDMEFFQKVNLPIEDTVEVYSIELHLGDYTHHFLSYQTEDNVDYNMYTASNYTDTFNLPKGTAFEWSNDIGFYWNPHYFNYHYDKILAAYNYINVYTQPKNTAKQVMRTTVLHNPFITIPNDSVEHTYYYHSNWIDDTSIIYLWAISSHTHELGTFFEIYRSDISGTAEELIYSGQHKDGDPNSIFIGYDWNHPPYRFFEYPNFRTIVKQEGFIMKASYMNDTDSEVTFGPLASDEMMTIFAMYLEDTTGLYEANQPTPTAEIISGAEKNGKIKINYINGNVLFMNSFNENVDVKIIDSKGGVIQNYYVSINQSMPISKNLSKGLYFINVNTQSGKQLSSKFIVE